MDEAWAMRRDGREQQAEAGLFFFAVCGALAGLWQRVITSFRYI